MNTTLTFSDIVLRVIAATFAGALVGLERESHGRPAGLRTTILACVASTVAMLVSEAFYLGSVAHGGNWHPDPGRISAGVLTGIGFLGAGTIFRHTNFIRGVTTAASLWFVTILGLAFGAGLFGLGFLGVCVALGTLFALPTLEKHIPSDRYATLTVMAELDALTEQQLQERLTALGLKVKRMDLNYDLAAKQKTITCELKMRQTPSAEVSRETLASLSACPGVLQIKWS